MDNLCNLCPNSCNLNRDIRVGMCGMHNNPIVARAALHMWEEPVISGNNGSGTIFFSGCSMRCVYCQNIEISQHNFGKEITISKLCDIMKMLEDKGAHNINFVSPTHYVNAIKKALDLYRPSIPIVYNSSGYENVSIIQELKGYIDIYLSDLKYHSDELCRKYSMRANYNTIAVNAIKTMIKQTGTPVIENGLLKSGVIIRHLALPSFIDDSKAVIDQIDAEIGYDNVLFSLMFQFTPNGNLEKYPEINRTLKPLETKILLNYLDKYKNIKGFVQELSSADKSFTPPFNLEGIE